MQGLAARRNLKRSQGRIAVGPAKSVASALVRSLQRQNIGDDFAQLPYGQLHVGHGWMRNDDPAGQRLSGHPGSVGDRRKAQHVGAYRGGGIGFHLVAVRADPLGELTATLDVSRNRLRLRRHGA